MTTKYYYDTLALEDAIWEACPKGQLDPKDLWIIFYDASTDKFRVEFGTEMKQHAGEYEVPVITNRHMCAYLDELIKENSTEDEIYEVDAIELMLDEAVVMLSDVELTTEYQLGRRLGLVEE